MGWTGLYTNRPTKDILAEELNFSNESGSARILEVATKGGVSYVAWERSYAAGSESMYAGKTFVIGVVVLHNRKNGEFTYKEMSEDMGPYESECPASVLNRLSPVTDFASGDCANWATAWRERCRAALAKRAAAPGNGATIRFKEPIKFTNGDTFDTFTIHKQGRKVRFAPLGSNYACYRISGWQLREYEILENTPQSTPQTVARSTSSASRSRKSSKPTRSSPSVRP